MGAPRISPSMRHGLVLSDRGNPEGDIFEHFDEDTAQTEHHGRAKGWIVDGTRMTSVPQGAIS